MGNLLYYRYMNPAIVAPDAFDIIEVSAGGQLTTEQRRNLGSVAKMLQHAASNKMFLGDNAHLNPINEYLSASHQKFRWGRGGAVGFNGGSWKLQNAALCCSKFAQLCLCRRFFLAACDVPSLEDKFNVDQYSDLVTVSKPVIYISIGEMINTHTVSLDHASLTAAVEPGSAAAPHCRRGFRAVLRSLMVCACSCCWTIKMPLLQSTMIPSMSCWRTWGRFPLWSL